MRMPRATRSRATNRAKFAPRRVGVWFAASGGRQTWGGRMEQSILVAADGPPPDEDATVALAWHLVGPAAKAITLAALAACVALTIAWSSQAPAAIATGLALGVITAAALVDAVDHRLPNGLVAMAAMPVGVAIGDHRRRRIARCRPRRPRRRGAARRAAVDHAPGVARSGWALATSRQARWSAARSASSARSWRSSRSSSRSAVPPRGQ